MMVVMFSFLCIFYIFRDLVPIFQKEQWKLFRVYSAMLVIAFIINLLLAVGVKILSPAVIIRNAVISILGQQLTVVLR